MSGLCLGDILIGQYRIERELGSGGFGRTYVAYDTRLEDQVVIKELLEKWVRTPMIQQRFINEAKAMRRLNHPNVVTIYNLLTPEAYPQLKELYIVMEYLAGGSLDARMRKGLTWEEAIQLTIGVCQGLDRAHAQGIVHRDIKPANILLSPDLAVVKISDFGIAHLPDRQQTMGLMHPGTLLYMAPEAFRRTPHQEIDGRADQYALGVTLYQLLTGKEYLNFDESLAKAEADLRRKHGLAPEVELNFEQQGVLQMLGQKYWAEAVCTVPAPDPRQHAAHLPDDLAEAVLRALAKDPRQRHPSMEALANDLRKVRFAKAHATTQVVSATGWQVNELIARSLEAARQQEFSTAFELIQQAVMLAPGSTRALATLANIQMMRGDFVAACQAWLKALEVDPAYPELYSKLGQCYNRRGQIDQAIEIQKQGWRRPENRRNAALLYGLANSYHLAQRLDEAIWALEQSLQIRPDGRLKALLEVWRNEGQQPRRPGED